jgi:hypothetical protein
MEQVALSQSSVTQKIEIYAGHLNSLMSAKSLKYSSWPQDAKDHLSESAGIYHFFEREEQSIISLYVGKAGYGDGDWSLYQRLKQHFQTSQKNALIGKIAKSSDQDPKSVKTSLLEREVYLQWLEIARKSNTTPDIEQELVWIECFCKSILKPKYTNA